MTKKYIEIVVYLKKGPKIVDKKGWEIYGQLLCVFVVAIFISLVEELLL